MGLHANEALWRISKHSRPRLPCRPGRVRSGKGCYVSGRGGENESKSYKNIGLMGAQPGLHRR
ncbi:hypothetical protein C8R32_102217 [Nitrosospira sp. Nsp5]|uniref:Uncharacterized protein n=1 Tax=Nitrosospira multiformis TaxID=1231 RepID=A0ABY0TKL5_9PROT|nr:hypothetical protein C8R32_102217 [Nitrosospira sp. Nsp5]SCX97137.1 hypothetical protein SAMN05216308_102199 [Nitrosospira sp. Nsp13]SDQ96789.1 hypothetical protein SAMN05216402_3041 [Nitrosospira multiformis]